MGRVRDVYGHQDTHWEDLTPIIPPTQINTMVARPPKKQKQCPAHKSISSHQVRGRGCAGDRHDAPLVRLDSDPKRRMPRRQRRHGEPNLGPGGRPNWLERQIKNTKTKLRSREHPSRPERQQKNSNTKLEHKPHLPTPFPPGPKCPPPPPRCPRCWRVARVLR